MILKRVCGSIVGALAGIAAAWLPGYALGFVCSLVIRDPKGAEGLVATDCLMLSFLVGAIIGAVAGWRYVRQQQERRPNTHSLPTERPDERTLPPPDSR